MPAKLRQGNYQCHLGFLHDVIGQLFACLLCQYKLILAMTRGAGFVGWKLDILASFFLMLTVRG